jgi:CheY-like chemotaxis protein
MARHERPDVVFLDQHLPDISGLEVLRRLRGDVATRRTPIVMISADDTPAQAQRMLLAGAQAYLTKPLDVSLVVSAIDEAIRVPAQVPIQLPAARQLV